MLLEDISSYFRFNKRQKLDTILIFLLPLVSGVILLIAANPSMIKEVSTSNLLLFGIVAVMPIWFLNLTIWSILGARFIRDIAKHSVELTKIQDKSKDFLISVIDEMPIISTFFGADVFKYISSVITVTASYSAAGIAYVTKTHLLTEYIVLITLSIFPALVWRLYNRKIIAKIKIEDIKPFWEKVVSDINSDEKFREHIIQRLSEIQQIIKDKKNSREESNNDI